MKLKDLVKKLAAKPNQDDEVQFCVWRNTKGWPMVCCDMSGDATTEIIQVLAKHAAKAK